MFNLSISLYTFFLCLLSFISNLTALVNIAFASGSFLINEKKIPPIVFFSLLISTFEELSSFALLSLTFFS